MSGQGASPFELEARRRKVQALVTRIDDVCGYCGLDAKRDGFAIADMLDGWSPAKWEALAAQATVNAPSKTTRDDVVAEFRERGRRAQQRGAA